MTKILIAFAFLFDAGVAMAAPGENSLLDPSDKVTCASADAQVIYKGEFSRLNPNSSLDVVDPAGNDAGYVYVNYISEQRVRSIFQLGGLDDTNHGLVTIHLRVKHHYSKYQARYLDLFCSSDLK